ncbi:hypothetical protein G6F65_014101 [Rhizopus arrhizus]|nr:hypothetical protein G6F65_014101 [Rhizopus arrhizus]
MATIQLVCRPEPNENDHHEPQFRSSADRPGARHLGQHLRRHHLDAARGLTADRRHAACAGGRDPAAAGRAPVAAGHLVAARVHPGRAEFLGVLGAAVRGCVPPARRRGCDLGRNPAAGACPSWRR